MLRTEEEKNIIRVISNQGPTQGTFHQPVPLSSFCRLLGSSWNANDHRLCQWHRLHLTRCRTEYEYLTDCGVQTANKARLSKFHCRPPPKKKQIPLPCINVLATFFLLPLRFFFFLFKHKNTTFLKRVIKANIFQTTKYKTSNIF
jgi:hypothetical protein